MPEFGLIGNSSPACFQDHMGLCTQFIPVCFRGGAPNDAGNGPEESLDYGYIASGVLANLPE